jgi:hypothetical protein
MKKQLHFLIGFCLAMILTGSTLDTYAWGGDVTLPATVGYKYTDARVSVAFDGAIYYSRMFSTSPTGSITNWEVLKSRDNGVTFTYIMGGNLAGSNKCTAVDIICAGENTTDFGLFVARAYLDTVSGVATLYMDKRDSAGTFLVSTANDSYTYSTSRGWTSLSLATDSREKNNYSIPYAISLVAGKANAQDSILVWTGNDGGTTMHRVGLYGTSGFIKNVSASIGSVTASTSGFGRLGITWDDYAANTDEWGSVYVMFIYPDDGTLPVYPGPYAIESGAANYRRPCVVISQNTAGGTGPGTSDYRAIVTTEYILDNNVWGAVYDSIVLKAPAYSWTKISAGSTTGVNSQCYGVFDPMYNNFLYTYYNDNANTLPYVVKSMGSISTDDAYFFQPNYRELSSASAVPMNPRVDMSISRANAAFAWNDNSNSMFDAEWSTVGISENSNTGIVELKLYPNPTSDLANISFTANDAQQLNVTVMDLTGRVFSNNEYTVNQGNNLLKLSVNELSAGNYIIRLTGSSISSTLKLVVMK